MQLYVFILLLISVMIYQVTALPMAKRGRGLCYAGSLIRERGLANGNAKRTQEIQHVNLGNYQSQPSASASSDCKPGSTATILYPNSLIDCDMDIEEESVYDSSNDSDDNKVVCLNNGVLAQSEE